MPVAFKESHKAKDELVRAVSGKSISHSMSEEGGVGVGGDYFDFKTSKQMFGFIYEKCSDAESNNI